MFIEELVRSSEEQGLYVNARELFKWLHGESKTKFTDWVKVYVRCEGKYDYGFVENVDYSNIRKKTKIEGTNISQQRSEYHLNLDMASHLCMLSNTDKGKEARKYFIKCEKDLHRLQIDNIKAAAMIFTHKDKLQLTNNVLYPILDRMGVLKKGRKRVHQLIKDALIGKYENITMINEFDNEEFIEDYRMLAEKMKEEYSNYFIDKNQVTIFDLLEECI